MSNDQIPSTVITKLSIRNILLEESTLQNHLDAQNNNYQEYLANLYLLFFEYNIELTILKLAKILTIALIRNDKGLSKFLLSNDRYELPVILKTCELLDSRRKHDQINKKTEKINDPKKLAKHKAVLANLLALNEGVEMRLTSSKIKFLKENWINNLSKERLEFMALLFPTKHWKWLIDLMHLKPSDFKLEWFTKYIFTSEYLPGSIVDLSIQINQDNILAVLNKYNLPYTYLRVKHKELLTNEVKEFIAKYTELSDIIRYWKEFNITQNVFMNFSQRVDNGESINMPYGELVKRIQMFKEEDNINDATQMLIYKLLINAEHKLTDYKINIESPVVVLGDASPSMDIAIKTSSIIASMLVKLCNAKLHLFRDTDEAIENPPKTVNEVLNAMTIFKSGGSTAPAASLYPYYKKKEVVKTFILVTDEEENCGYVDDTHKNNAWSYSSDKENYFASLFKKYREEIYPAKLVFVSFLRNNKDGQMVKHLKELIPDIEKDIIQFILNSQKPDLRKLDSLLNKLTMETDTNNSKFKDLLEFINTGNNNNLYNIEDIHNVLSGKFLINVDEEFDGVMTITI